jgi:hypothetical protein
MAEKEWDGDGLVEMGCIMHGRWHAGKVSMANTCLVYCKRKMVAFVVSSMIAVAE